MEAQSEGGGSGGSDDSGGSNGGEVRRVYIIYFLSRKGRIEHPHLIRVHHLSRNGVRLRDVKRWLSELRGKDMPESFSWSYKRRYKTGHVWQDLVDEALITPISDNEYVLKGSEIPSTNFDLPSHGEEKDSMQKELHPDQKDARDHKWSPKEEIQEHPETTMDVLTKTSPEIEEEEEEEESPPFGFETSTLIDDSMKLGEEKHSETNKQETQEQSVEFESSSSSSHSTLLNKKDRKKRNNIKVENPSSSSTWSSNMLRSFIKCGAVDTNDSATVMIKRRDKSSSYIPPTTTTTTTPNVLKIKLIENENAAEICKGDKLGGSERIFGTTWNQQQHPHPKARRKSCDGMKSFNRNKSEFNNQNPVSTA